MQIPGNQTPYQTVYGPCAAPAEELLDAEVEEQQSLERINRHCAQGLEPLQRPHPARLGLEQPVLGHLRDPQAPPEFAGIGTGE